MARTFRRVDARHDYSWTLDDPAAPLHAPRRLDPRSVQGRRALARYHSDATITLAQTAPRWYRKISDRRIRMRNRMELHRWLRNPDFDPVFRDWHKHEANWSWW